MPGSGRTVINGKDLEANAVIDLKVGDEILLGKHIKLTYEKLSSHTLRPSTINSTDSGRTLNYQNSLPAIASQNDLTFIEWVVGGKTFKIRKGDLASVEFGLSDRIKDLKMTTRSKEAEIMSQMDSETVIQRIKASQELYQKLCSVFANRQLLLEADEAVISELENPLLAFGGAINPLKVLAKSKIEKLQKSVLQLEFLSTLSSLGEKSFEKAIEVYL